TSAPAPSGRRRRRTTPTRRSGSTAWPRSQRRSRCRSSRSAASTPRTRPTASGRAPPASRSSARPSIPRSAGRSMRLSQLGELGLLAELERRGLIVGVEHDAAELGGGLVVTQDALVEGVHFTLDRISWRDLGWRAAAVNLSDLAASGAEPEGLLVSLGAPGRTELEAVVEVYEGMREAGGQVIGGDTTASERAY